jgi:hypothetical protein
MLHNVSFKREPDASFQEVDIRERERSKLQKSQSSQGRSLSGSQAQGATGDIGNFTSSVYVGAKGPQAGGLESKQQTEQKATESKLSQSGVKNVQTPQQVSDFENITLVKSGIYSTQMGGQYGSAQGQGQGQGQGSASSRV